MQQHCNAEIFLIYNQFLFCFRTSNQPQLSWISFRCYLGEAETAKRHISGRQKVSAFSAFCKSCKFISCQTHPHLWYIYTSFVTVSWFKVWYLCIMWKIGSKPASYTILWGMNLQNVQLFWCKHQGKHHHTAHTAALGDPATGQSLSLALSCGTGKIVVRSTCSFYCTSPF